MLFYRVEVKMSGESEAVNRREQDERAASMQSKIEEFYNKSEQSCHISVTSIDYKKQKITLCAVLKKRTLSEKMVASFLDAVGLPYKNGETLLSSDIEGKEIDIQEITLESYFNLLRASSRNCFIADEDDVMEKLHIDELHSRRGCTIKFSETLVCGNETKTELLKKSAELLCNNALSAEINRIYQTHKYKNVPAGHPVHYLLQSDNRESRNKVLRILHTALYQNGRIASRRYCEVNLDGFEGPSEKELNVLYETCSGGTMVISVCEDVPDEGRYANTRAGLIAMICALVRKYRNSVLTVFCLPSVGNKAKDAFLENLGAITVVPICEEVAVEGGAKAFLRALAKQYNVRPNLSLYRPIISGKGFSAADLNLIFDEWYDRRLKTDIYTQYAELQTVNKQLAAKKPKGSAYDELQKMIGLKEAKSVIQQAINFYKVQNLFKGKGLRSERPAMNMVFTGNPGTAKTTVARLFAQIMKDNGLLSVGDLYEVGRADLVGKYVGWTAQIVKQKFKAAKGSVLFIDEAYSLVEKDGYFGDEAINTIVQEMENNREDMIVIFAGYPEEMGSFLDKNPGLRSRIAFHVPFADYSAEELFEITELMASAKNVTLADGVKEKVIPIYEAAMHEDNFGNGRFARNLFEKARMKQASRLVAMNVDNVTKEEISMLLADDFEMPVSGKTAAARKIGFMA
jgi:AAA+ superfamily predicted ATPase